MTASPSAGAAEESEAVRRARGERVRKRLSGGGGGEPRPLRHSPGCVGPSAGGCAHKPQPPRAAGCARHAAGCGAGKQQRITAARIKKFKLMLVHCTRAGRCRKAVRSTRPAAAGPRGPRLNHRIPAHRHTSAPIQRKRAPRRPPGAPAPAPGPGASSWWASASKAVNAEQNVQNTRYCRLECSFNGLAS
jgi:hypothetical protein